MDKLKEYLLRHKADLDVDSPASDAWDSMESKLPSPGSSGWVVKYAAAACVIALAGVGLWMGTRGHKAVPDTVLHEKPIPKEEKAPSKDIVRSDVPPKRAPRKGRSQKPAELSDIIGAIDKSYSGLIDYQLKKLRATPLYAENGNYFSFYIEQFKQMELDEREVRNAIKAYGLTNQFLDQLINVYQQKLNLLKNLQTEINKMNNKVRERQTPADGREVHYLNI